MRAVDAAAACRDEDGILDGSDDSGRRAGSRIEAQDFVGILTADIEVAIAKGHVAHAMNRPFRDEDVDELPWHDAVGSLIAEDRVGEGVHPNIKVAIGPKGWRGKLRPIDEV